MMAYYFDAVVVLQVVLPSGYMLLLYNYRFRHRKLREKAILQNISPVVVLPYCILAVGV